MRLAERLGVSLKKLLGDYSRKEIDLWLAWIAKEPSEGERIELAVARLASMTHNINSKKKSTYKDYLFKVDWTPEITADINVFRQALSNGTR